VSEWGRRGPWSNPHIYVTSASSFSASAVATAATAATATIPLNRISLPMDPEHVPLLSLTPLRRPPPTRSLPVDPEHVPDYYDVVTCPMDMETMRMKVLIRPLYRPLSRPLSEPLSSGDHAHEGTN
jgi:Bromodomain